MARAFRKAEVLPRLVFQDKTEARCDNISYCVCHADTAQWKRRPPFPVRHYD
jgi:hypothetical protein